ncbi:MAG: hypothetical protein RMJ88_04000 [Thermogemmata sp.]|nr:hypothetical protein [Thermogemmata sp.]
MGVELYHDIGREVLLALSEKGWIAAIKAPPIGADKQSRWLTAHDLHARKAEEKEFTATTRKYGVEVYQDLATQQMLYVCESGSVALAPLPAGLVTDRGPKFHHALTLRVRKPTQNDFAMAPRFGIEVYRDTNTPDGLLYLVSETGSLAVTNSKQAAIQPPPAQVNNPDTLYGLILRVRTAEEKTFTSNTRRIGIEVYRDTNTEGHLVYLSETGAIAVALPSKFDESKRGVSWLGGMALRVRPTGEKSFEKARQYSIEVFQDNRTGNLIYVCETGSIAVVSR